MTQKIYLVQHGEAEPESINPERPLTIRGRQSVHSVSAFAAKLGIQIHQIRHSGKTRAQQTALLFGESLSPSAGIIMELGLNPNDDVSPLAQKLAHESFPIMYVGHLPFLSRLAGLLVIGNLNHSIIQFRYANVVCLSRESDHWLVDWIITPEMANVIDEIC